jgi:hypothetical protein
LTGFPVLKTQMQLNKKKAIIVDLIAISVTHDEFTSQLYVEEGSVC